MRKESKQIQREKKKTTVINILGEIREVLNPWNKTKMHKKKHSWNKKQILEHKKIIA